MYMREGTGMHKRGYRYAHERGYRYVYEKVQVCTREGTGVYMREGTGMHKRGYRCVYEKVQGFSFASLLVLPPDQFCASQHKFTLHH